MTQKQQDLKENLDLGAESRRDTHPDVYEGEATVRPGSHDYDSLSVKKQPEFPGVKTNDHTYYRFGWLVVILVFVVFGGWAALAPLSSSAVAPGEVQVEESNRTVEHYEGGIVSEILVEEGEIVEKGEVLLRLSPTQAASELNTVQSQLNSLLALEARLVAERSGKERVSFPPSLLQQAETSDDVQELIEGQRALFDARRNGLNQELKIYGQQVSALKQQISGLQEQIKSLDNRIASYEEEVEDWQALYDERFADKVRLQEMKRELSRLKGERAGNLSETARLKVKVAETESQRVLRKQQFLQEVVAELKDVQTQKYELQARKTALLDRLKRVEIRSPASGKVNGLKIHTVGAVVRSGDPLMEIVPKTQNFVVLARVKPQDIDKVRVGLMADVVFSAFNTQSTHVITGEVTKLSADSFTDEQSGEKYFEARVRITPEGVKQMKEDGIFMLPGMPAETMIKTGERTFFG
ncbi:MAG: HlyD family type I secretion periplasmic adaptor subunit, partial [Hydrogenovibrio sp.]|uniref:HlyD family type I secretion periplasmic adaptor subunit n=1 Tax=Hydrogenovibrio sp. TaxID=2065821 RepID=UPI00286FCA10